MEIDALKEMIELMKKSELKVMSIKDGEMEIYLEDHVEVIAQTSIPVATSQADNGNQAPERDHNIVEIKADQIGVFYTQPEEDSEETFVNVGDHVDAGDPIGLIEIMKLFNEVTVEQPGTIEEILVENGATVEYDQVLMLLRIEE